MRFCAGPSAHSRYRGFRRGQYSIFRHFLNRISSAFLLCKLIRPNEISFQKIICHSDMNRVGSQSRGFVMPREVVIVLGFLGRR